jgi:cobalt-precorrin 5A hydrolase
LAPPPHAGLLHLGVGVATSADVAALIALAEQARALAGGGLFASIATIETRQDHPGLLALAAHYNLAVMGWPADVLETQTPRLHNPSDAVFARIGCHGVAEAAALANAGRSGKLVVGKLKASRMTVAVAVGAEIV